MRHTCKSCNSADITLKDTQEGWDANGEYGLHVTQKHYRCRACGKTWTETTRKGKASDTAGRAVR